MLQRVASLLRMTPPITDDRGLLFSSGATVPTDGTDGYQVGCIFQHTDGGAGTALYVNEGSVTSCDFNPVEAGGFTGPLVFDGVTTDDAIQVTGTYERAFDLSSWTPGTTTDGVVMRVGSGIGTSALALPSGGRGIAMYLRNTSTGSLTGMRLRCVTDPAAAAGNTDGLLVQASVVASKDGGVINAGFFEFIPKGTNTISYARGLLVNVDQAASVTYTNQLTVAHFRVQGRGDETMSGDDEILRLENIANGGNGRQLDSFIKCMATSLSGGTKAAAYIIDAGTATDILGTAFVRLGDDSSVTHSTDTGDGTAIARSDFAGYITVVIGTATRYIPLMDVKTSAL